MAKSTKNRKIRIVDFSDTNLHSLLLVFPTFYEPNRYKATIESFNRVYIVFYDSLPFLTTVITVLFILGLIFSILESR